MKRQRKTVRQIRARHKETRLQTGHPMPHPTEKLLLPRKLRLPLKRMPPGALPRRKIRKKQN